MLRFESLSGKAIKAIKKNADSQVYESGKASSGDYTYIFVKESVICTFMLIPEAKRFQNPLLKSHYYLSVTFIGMCEENKVTVQPFNSEHAKKIVKKFFPETESVWEHPPTPHASDLRLYSNSQCRNVKFCAEISSFCAKKT